MNLRHNFAHTKCSSRNSTTEEPSIGLLRFIARLNKRVLPYCPTPAEVEGGAAIEGSDVFLVNGQTRSKCQPFFDCFLVLRLILLQSTQVNNSSMTRCTAHGGRGSVRLGPFRGNATSADLFPIKLHGLSSLARVTKPVPVVLSSGTFLLL